MDLRIEITEGKVSKLVEGGEGNKYTIDSMSFFTPDIWEKGKFEHEKIEEICKRFHGVAIEESEQYIRIYNDPFCSHPIYINSIGEDKILVSTQFSDVYQHGSDLAIDHCGIYELLWLGQMLYDRTIFKNVKQLPAASFCEIHRKTMAFTIKTYFNFEIFEDSDIDSQDKAEDMVYRQLKRVFKKYKNANILMGLSGGLDSRLSACLLSDVSDRKKLKFFTFGYDKHILEYRFAKKVSKRLNLPSPVFVKLDQKDYKDAEELALRTGCHIGMNHGHTYQCLKRSQFKESGVFVSNYYSDAVMGWDAKRDKVIEKIEELELYKKICKNRDKIPKENADNVVSEALNDLKNIVTRYDTNSNFSCFEEFFYVTERNTKFHVRSAYQCNDIMATDIPFADFDLLSMCISIPLKYRWEKKLEKNIINKHYFQERDISSRRYYERSNTQEQVYSMREKIYYKGNFLLFKGLSYANVILGKISNNKIQIINPYHTENQRIIFERYFEREFLHAVNYLLDLGIINSETFNKLRKKRLRGNEIGLKFAIIGLKKALKIEHF